MTTESKIEIPEVTDLDGVFGGADKHLPPWDSIPDEFKRTSNRWCRIVSALFFKGGRLSDHGVRFRADVDARRAFRLTQALLGSFGPKHEHKEAGVAYLLSQWCEEDAP